MVAPVYYIPGPPSAFQLAILPHTPYETIPVHCIGSEPDATSGSQRCLYHSAFRGVELDHTVVLSEQTWVRLGLGAAHEEARHYFLSQWRQFLAYHPGGRWSRMRVNYAYRSLSFGRVHAADEPVVLLRLVTNRWDPTDLGTFCQTQEWEVTEGVLPLGRRYIERRFSTTMPAPHTSDGRTTEADLQHNTLAMRVYSAVHYDLREHVDSGRSAPMPLIPEARLAVENDLRNSWPLQSYQDAILARTNAAETGTLATDVVLLSQAAQWGVLDTDLLTAQAMWGMIDEVTDRLAQEPTSPQWTRSEWPRSHGSHRHLLESLPERLQREAHKLKEANALLNYRLRDWAKLFDNRPKKFLYQPRLGARRSNPGQSGILYFYNYDYGCWFSFNVCTWSTPMAVENNQAQDLLHYFWAIHEKTKPDIEPLFRLTLRRYYDWWWDDLVKPLLVVERDRVQRGPRIQDVLRYRLKGSQWIRQELQRPHFERQPWEQAGFGVTLENENTLALTYRLEGFRFEDRWVIQGPLWVVIKMDLKRKKYIAAKVKSGHKNPHPHVMYADPGEWGALCAGTFKEEFETCVFDPHSTPTDLVGAITRYLNVDGRSSRYHEICECGWLAYDTQEHAFVKPSYVCHIINRRGQNRHCGHSHADEYVTEGD